MNSLSHISTTLSTTLTDSKGLSKTSLTETASDCLLDTYPSGTKVTKVASTLDIKRLWLYNEWDGRCQFSKYIRPYFPEREALGPAILEPNVELIQSTFDKVRGRYALWQTPREQARWKKVEVPDLKIAWVDKNVEVLYPSEKKFEVDALYGTVLWKDKQPGAKKKYKLYEGNHRISAWLAVKQPLGLPAILYIGKPAK